MRSLSYGNQRTARSEGGNVVSLGYGPPYLAEQPFVWSRLEWLRWGTFFLVDTPAGPFNFQFDYLFETLTGELVVTLDGGPIVTIPAPNVLDSLFTMLVVPVNGPLLLNLNDILLAFTVDGLSGSQVLLDNIIFPELLNGDSETGDFSEWTVTTEGNASADVVSFGLDLQAATASEPATFLLLALGLTWIAAIRREWAHRT